MQKGSSEFIIHCLANLEFWDLNTGMHWPIQQPSYYGKRSSGTFAMVLKLQSTSLSWQGNKNGNACAAWYSCCRMVMKDRGRNTAVPEWKDFCKCAQN